MDAFRNGWVKSALILSALLPMFLLAVALATKFGLLDWHTGFVTLTMVLGPILAMLALGVGLLAVGFSCLIKPQGKGLLRAGLAALIPAVLLGGAFVGVLGAAKAPPIHDISTDTLDPPSLSEASAVARAKLPRGNGVAFAGERIPKAFGPYGGKLPVEAQRAAYPDIKTYNSALPPADLFEIVLDAARAQGWRVMSADPAKGRIEAEVTSFFYGFTDDIVVRIRPLSDGSGSAVDVRSSSRVGVGDMGANARRVRLFLNDLHKQVGDATTG